MDVWVEKGRESVYALRLDHLGALGLTLAGRGQLGNFAAADDDVVDAIDPGHRVEHSGPAQDCVGDLAGTHVKRLGEAHAGCPIGVTRTAPSPSASGVGRSPP